MDIEVRERVEEEASDKPFPVLQPVGRTSPPLQPLQPVLHPVGRQQASSQPAEQVARVVRQGR